LEQTQAIDAGDEGMAEWDGSVDAIGAAWLALNACREAPAENAARAAANVLNRVYQRLSDGMVGSTYVLSAQETGDLLRKIDEHPLMKRARERLLEIIAFLRSRPDLTSEDLACLRRHAGDPL
jgi:hypothetical protein